MERVPETAGSSIGQPGIVLRPAQPDDQQNLFSWRNHPNVRQFSLQQAEINWEAHCQWLQNTLKNPLRILLIGEIHRQAIGVLRYDLKESSALVSIYLVPTEMGKGYGTPLLKAGHQWLTSNQPAVSRIHAEITPENIASVKTFEKAGYQPSSTQTPQGILKYEYELKIS